ERQACLVRPCSTPRGFFSRLRLRHGKPGMIEKSSTGRSQLDSMHAAGHQLGADLLLKCADLPTKRRLRCVQPPLGSQRQASLLGDRDEIAKVPQLHDALHASEACRPTYKVFYVCATVRFDCAAEE